MQSLTYETMSENIDMTDATYCKTCSLWIDVLSYKDVSVSKFYIGRRVCMHLVTQFRMFTLDRHVTTQICRLQHVFMRVFAH